MKFAAAAFALLASSASAFNGFNFKKAAVKATQPVRSLSIEMGV